MIKPIRLNCTTEECEKLLPFTKGKWKPYNEPMIDRKEITIINLIDSNIAKFKFPIPKK